MHTYPVLPYLIYSLVYKLLRHKSDLFKITNIQSSYLSRAWSSYASPATFSKGVRTKKTHKILLKNKNIWREKNDDCKDTTEFESNTEYISPRGRNYCPTGGGGEYICPKWAYKFNIAVNTVNSCFTIWRNRQKILKRKRKRIK